MAKSTLYQKNIKEIKGKTAIAELQRTHLIIALLSFAVIPLLMVGAIAPIQFNLTLSLVLVALLVILGSASLCTAYMLYKRK